LKISRISTPSAFWYEDPADCYRALGIMHQRWRCVPERFRDYISVPKPNNYRSLHTTIIGPGNLRVELQIRTEDMERIAEDGVAAHWRYKAGSYAYDPKAAEAAGGDPMERLRPLMEILNHGGDPDEFLEHAKLEMFANEVYAFTPKGDLIALPGGATPLDFAYAVHTELGHTAIGAKINGRERPLRTRLSNGDVVQIIKGGERHPPAGWEDLVITGRARAAIRRLIRSSETEEFAHWQGDRRTRLYARRQGVPRGHAGGWP
jgi:guanosine-3',5'-bis(diphosphate) 3'-pyrophosphohydrolase